MNAFSKVGLVLTALVTLCSANGQGLLSGIYFDRVTKITEIGGGTDSRSYAGTDFDGGPVTFSVPLSSGGGITSSYDFRNGAQSALIDIATSFSIFGQGSTVPVGSDAIEEKGLNGNTPIFFHLDSDVTYNLSAVSTAIYQGSSSSSTSINFQLYRVSGQSMTPLFGSEGVGENRSGSVTYYESGSLSGGFDYQLLSSTLGNLFYYNIGDLSGETRMTLELTQIPEPSTYAAIIGAVTLGYVAIRRRNFAA